MDPQRAATIMERFDQAIDTLDAAAVLPRLLDRANLDAPALELLDRDYFLAGVPCPFLDDQGACGIHAERPLACREYLVTSPAVHCAEPVAGRVQRLELGTKISLGLLNTETTGWIPLVLARQFVAEHREPSVVSPPEELARILNSLP